MADVLVIENSKKLADLFASDLMLAGFRVKTAVGYIIRASDSWTRLRTK